MDSGIYKILCKENNRCYVGKTVNFKDRKKDHFWHLKKDTHTNQHLQNSYNKYGFDSFSFEIIYVCEEEYLNEKEISYIKELNAHVSLGGFNLSWGGELSMLGMKHSEETIQKMRIAQAGKILSDEHKKKISESNKGKVFSEKTKQKMSENHADFSNEKHPLWGTTHSEETRKKMSENHADVKGKNSPLFGKEFTEEHKKNISLSQQGIKNWQFGKKKKNASSKYFGVHKYKGYKENIYWVIQITVNCKLIRVGKYFKTEIEAAKAYNDYIIENNLSEFPLNDLDA